ncbi:prepilin-type N-terminal cleavage/methylation domain-containing protein [Pseudoalteromonas sp. T1lg65]|uniref:prepilin-type N-terminal cleavage/methylation domain-containing protein n=1 Tax=Pseudoalteromonas sp. T1lg65 TaxID=2077101 RepID=UPI003F7968EC
MIGKQQGFTLVELLIALTLLSLVMTTGTYAYFQFASRWDKELGDFQQQAKLAKATAQLDQVLKGIVPYVVRNAQGEPSFMFTGSESRLLGVTKNGLNHGGPEVFRLVIQVQGERSRLVYQSAALSTLMLTSTEQNIDFGTSKVILNDIKEASFSYLGWRDLTLKSSRIPGSKPQWFAQYNALERKLTPEHIKLQIDNSSLLATLDKEPERWRSHFIEGGSL